MATAVPKAVIHRARYLETAECICTRLSACSAVYSDQRTPSNSPPPMLKLW